VTTTVGNYGNFVLAQGSHPAGVITDTDAVTVTVTDPSVNVEKDLVFSNPDSRLVTFTIRVENTGPSTLDQVPVIDRFSGPVEYVGGTPPADVVDNANQVIAWTDLTTVSNIYPGFGGDLQPGQAYVLTTVYRIIAETEFYSMTNVVTVTDAVDVFTNEASDDSDTERVVNEPTAIELLYFEGEHLGDHVELSWATAVEIDTFGFRIMRSDTGQYADAVMIALVPGQGHGTTSGSSYTYTDDQSVEPDQTYTYWLVDIDFNGVETVQSPITVEPANLNNDGARRLFLPIIIKSQ
jgi:uncharacterized repeat protein (TIGR01451 family)